MKFKSLLDPSFIYTSSNNTDIRETFARVRKEMEQAKEKEQPQQNVVPLKKAST